MSTKENRFDEPFADAERRPALRSEIVAGLEVEVASALGAFAAISLLVVSIGGIAWMYAYNEPRLSPTGRLLASAGLLALLVAEGWSMIWLNGRRRDADHLHPVAIAAGLRVRIWPVRLALAGWWLAQAAAVVYVADFIVHKYGNFAPDALPGKLTVYAMQVGVLFFATYGATVYGLIGLSAMGAGKTSLTRVYRLRFVIDLAVALLTTVGLRAARGESPL